MITRLVFILIGLVWFANGVYIDMNGYLGCYVNNLKQHEFNSFAAHLDASKLTPRLCSKACSAIGYSLAAIERGTMCFCKFVEGVRSVRDDDANCTSIPCAGESNLACGSVTNIMVYEAGAISRAATADASSSAGQTLNPSMPLKVFSPIRLHISYMGQIGNLYVKENREFSAQQNISDSINSASVNYFLTNVGVQSYELTVSSMSISSYQSSRIATASATGIDSLTPINITCPVLLKSTDNVFCYVSYASGTNLQASVNYGDGTQDTCNLMDVPFVNYGLPVPKFLVYVNSYSTANNVYLATNTEIYVSSYLRAIEVFALANGPVQIDVVSISCSPSNYVAKNMDFSCDDVSRSAEYNCGSSVYSVTENTCASTNKAARYSAYLTTPINLVTIYSFTLTLSKGYNLLTDETLGSNLLLQPGYMLRLTSLNQGLVALDTYGCQIPDYQIDPLYQMLLPIDPINNYRLYLRSIVAPVKTFGVYKQYARYGMYNMSVTVSNPLLNESYTAAQSVTLQEPITGLQLLNVFGSICYTNVDCSFQAILQTGSDVYYQWTIGTIVTNTTVNTYSYQFSLPGSYLVNVLVGNLVSLANTTINVTVLDHLYGLSFKSGSGLDSSSLVGSNADFLFILAVGQSYQCYVDFGDGQNTTISDSVYVINNTYVSHLYTTESLYHVKIQCVNPISAVNLTFDHIVQYPLTGLRLVSNVALVNTAYQIQFVLTSGSTPTQINFIIDNVKQSAFTYVNYAGSSVQRAAESTARMFNVYINMSNYVSFVELNATFEVSSPIRNSKFTISPSSGLSAYTYLYPVTLKFIISADSGSNVRLVLNTDSGSLFSTLPNNIIDIQTVGDWFANINDLINRVYVINYNYTNPGDYTIFLNMSNALGYTTFNQNIRIISKVDSLIANLDSFNSYVAYDMSVGYGVGDFLFTFYGNTKAGSHASVTFWSGDAFNSTNGPFPLNMDFNTNVSKTSLKYTYSSMGTYMALFLVNNPVGSKVLRLTVNVVMSMIGLYIDVSPPCSRPNSPVTISAYLIQGNSVNYTWLVDGVQIANGPRLATSYITADSRVYSPTSVRNYTIQLIAIDLYTSLQKTFTLEVQVAILSMSVVVNPSTPQRNVDNVPSTRSFSFTTTLTPPDATNVMYLIDYGDGSPINMPAWFTTPSMVFAYTYKTSGIFNVNITVFNKVSSFSQTVQVQIYSNFSHLDCVPYWRQYPVDTSPDVAYQLEPGQLYTVQKEYDIRFYCTWVRLDAVPNRFDVFLNRTFLLSVTNVSTLPQLKSNQSVGYIVTLNTSYIKSGEITIQVSNVFYSVNSTKNLSVTSAIINIEWIDLSSVFLISTNTQFQITYTSLGEPSCMYLSYITSAGFNFTLGFIGSNQATCFSMFPSLSVVISAAYLGDYPSFTTGQAANTLTFSTTKITRVGNHRLGVNVINTRLFVRAYNNVTAVSQSQLGLCDLPMVDIVNKSSRFYQPAVYTRTSMVSVSGLCVLNCSSGLSNVKQWLMYSVNDQTGDVLNQISLVNNPSVNYSELIIQPSSLNYGLYKVAYQVTMAYNAMYTDLAETFFQIVPSGIVVATLYGSIGGGTYEISRGTQQDISLKPTVYSYDLDWLADISRLTFVFYCKVIDNGIDYGYPALYYNAYIDLLTIKNTYKTDARIQNLLANNNHTCFNTVDRINFDSTGKQLNISAGALAYVPNRIYEFLVQTTYMGNLYSQRIRVNILNYNYLPLINLKCKFDGTCLPYNGFVKINPNTQLMVDATCYDGCDYLLEIEYLYNVYKQWVFSNGQEIWLNYQDPANIFGKSTTTLTMSSALFAQNVTRWKIEFTLTSTTYTDGIATGSAAMIVQLNQLPTGGSCAVSPNTGIAGNVTFVITCPNWKDIDGYITSYAFYCSYTGGMQETLLGTSQSATFSSLLPVGSPADSYNIYLRVEIIDNDNGVSSYDVPTPVAVTPDVNLIDSLMTQFANGIIDPSLSAILFSGNSQQVTQAILSISSVFNQISLADQLGLVNSGGTSGAYFPASFANNNYAGINATSNITLQTYEANRNVRSLIVDYLAGFINNLSISNINSIMNQASMLNSLTNMPDQITRSAADSITNQIIRLLNAMTTLPGSTSVENLVFTSNLLTGTLGNILSGLSNFLNNRQSNLNIDFTRANTLPEYYDTDLENFWTNPNNFMDYDGSTSSSDMETNVNIQQQKFMNVDIYNKANTIVNVLTKLVSMRFPTGASYTMNTSSLSLGLYKVKASDLASTYSLQNAKVKLPSFCDLVTTSKTTTTTTTESPYVNFADDRNCTNKVITLKMFVLPMAISGHNGRNESYVGFSYGLDMDFFDENGNRIIVKDTLKPIEFWIPRNKYLPQNYYVHVNASSVNISSSSQILQNGFFINQTNSSVHIQIKPANFSIAYLTLIKLGSSPFINSTYSSYDFWQLLCPNSSFFYNVTVSTGYEAYYLLFLNMSQMAGFNGFVGFGLRELTQAESALYCANPPNSPPILDTNVTNFTTDFSVKSYTSGCYYYTPATGKWYGNGVEIFADSTLVTSHCETNHFTQFASGLVIIPTKIDFQYVLAYASPERNPLIYAVALTLLSLYVLSSIVGYMVDREDDKRIGITVLADNAIGNDYYYEVIVFTGDVKSAETDSNVKLVINGDLDETEIRSLSGGSKDDRKPFRRGGVDSFVMSLSRPLGKLNYCRVWHDNSGYGSRASWYLKHIVVHDLQTREKFFFPCERWLAVEKMDGRIERLLGVGGQKQLNELKFQSSVCMNDGHLWLSVFKKPPRSSFRRVDRIGCCFVLLFLFMLVNIVYYQTNFESRATYIDIGPFSFTPYQFALSILINILVFPPGYLFIQIFKRCKRRQSRTNQLRKAINQNVNLMKFKNFSSLNETETITNTQEEVNSNGAFTKYAENRDAIKIKRRTRILFPWWVRIIMHVVCLTIILMCAILSISKGIEFGNVQVQKWLGSFLLFVITSILLIQPIQMYLMAYVMYRVFKRESRGFEKDKINLNDDDLKPVNPNYSMDIYAQGANPFKVTNFEEYRLNESELAEAKARRVRDMKINDAIRETIIYMVFISLLFYVVYSNNNNYGYYYQKTMSDNFKISITTVDDFWNWTINSMAFELRASTWYNNDQPYGLAGYMRDYSSRMVGYGLLRQIRIKNNSCTINNKLNRYINFCDEDLSLFNEDTETYGYSWSQFNDSFVPAHGMDQVYNSFQYRDAERLQGYPYTGVYNTYLGGGYVYELRGSLKFVVGNLSILQHMGWIDRQTRAVFVEFSAFNPNINLLMVTTILVEFLPSGNLLTLIRFDPLNLFNEINSDVATTFKLIVYFLYMVFIVYFTFTECFEFYKKGARTYMSQFWNYIEWMMLIFSYVSCALFFYRLSTAYQVADFFKKTSGYGYIKLQRINYWNQVLSILLAGCGVFGTLKFLKILRFNRKIYALALTLKYCLRELFGFFMVFLVMWVAFVVMINLLWYDTLSGYYTIFRTMTTTFQILLGKFDATGIYVASKILGPIVFSGFHIVIIFTLVNIFISIVCDGFKAIRMDFKNHEDLRFVDYFLEKFNVYVKKKPVNESESQSYIMSHEMLPITVDRFIDNLSKAYDEDADVDKMLKNAKEWKETSIRAKSAKTKTLKSDHVNVPTNRHKIRIPKDENPKQSRATSH